MAEWAHGQRRIVRHVGSANDEVSLGLLMAEARRLVDGDLQGELDLGLTVPVRRVGLLGPPSVPGLFTGTGKRARRSVVPAPVVVKTFSAVLFDAIAGVYDDLGFGALGDLVFRDLVVARVVEPTSLVDVDRVLADLGRVAASHSTRRRTLRLCCKGLYRERLATLCYANALTLGDLSLVLYDVTTLRTQADAEDQLRRVGYSKDRSIDPQITVGLLVDRLGNPLEIACFEGNKAEKNTIIGVVEAFEARYGTGRLVVVADAGMLSAANLKALDDAHHRFIVGAKVSKAPIDLASHFRWHGDAFVDGQLIDTLTPKVGANLENPLSTKDEPTWDPQAHPGSWRAIWSYTAKRFVRDNMVVNKQANRAQAVIDGQKTTRTPRFVKKTAGSYHLDEAALARARRLVGLKGYVTNIPAIEMSAAEVIGAYHDLWHVEESFRIFKSDLAARPFFARKRDAIEAHLTIVFAALAVTRTIQTRTGITIRRFLRTIRPLRSATIHANGTTQTLPPAIDPDQQATLNTLTQHRH